jgi:hypothetical protein
MLAANEARHRVISALLQAGGPCGLGKLAEACELSPEEAAACGEGLVAEGLAVVGQGGASTSRQYRWAARWREELQRRTVQAERELREYLDAAGPATADVFGESARRFSEFVTTRYRPPEDKRLLVILQCSVGRPFSSSPSQAFMRRAISSATGRDPAHDFAQCPVHVVVLASEVGPAPYEFENVPPANISAGGVKHFGEERYLRAREVLADRMAAYLRAHRACYDQAASFTHGRYGEVLAEAQARAEWRFPIFPAGRRPVVRRIGDSTPRTYWQKYWVQLFFEVTSWLSPTAQALAAARLEADAVVWE